LGWYLDADIKRFEQHQNNLKTSVHGNPARKIEQITN
jgi:hypothetical protein